MRIDVLNTGRGELVMKFDENNPEEVERAKQAIDTLLAKGYMFIVHTLNGDEKVNLSTRPKTFMS